VNNSGLWIGNAFEARYLAVVLDAEFEAIVDLALEEPPIATTRDFVYCRIPLFDGAGNTLARIQLAIATVSRLVSSDVPTLVACSAGMSRSPVIVAASMAHMKTTSFEEALSQISQIGPCDVSPALLSDVATVLKGTIK
jgi:protein-tyrosine phosphatase